MPADVRLYNSLTRRIEPFAPRDTADVKMFVCGPTVYDGIHIGNARTFTVFDVLAKWLRYRGYGLTYLQNITDVDDRIIARAAEASEDALVYARRYEQIFRDDMQALGNDAVDQFVRATDHITQVIAQVKTLRDKGHAYLIEGDGWYFDLSTFADYGKLSGRTSLQAEDAVSRIDDNTSKRNAGDFCLWKLSKPGEPVWDEEELGAGRPGWHIEDTAMTEHYFGPQYDLHGGGIDLKFPHHEAEIAQQEAASGKIPFVRHWMHAGFLQLDGSKMSKSVGNILRLRDALERYGAPALRFFFLSALWSDPLDCSDRSLDAASAAVQRIGEAAQRCVSFPYASGGGNGLDDRFTSAHDDLVSAMDDNLNTPRAFGILFECVSDVNQAMAAGTLTTAEAASFRGLLTFASDIFGIVPAGPPDIPDEVLSLVSEREDARSRKDWDVADNLRLRLSELGWRVDDTSYGPLIKKD